METKRVARAGESGMVRTGFGLHVKEEKLAMKRVRMVHTIIKANICRLRMSEQNTIQCYGMNFMDMLYVGP